MRQINTLTPQNELKTMGRNMPKLRVPSLTATPLANSNTAPIVNQSLQTDTLTLRSGKKTSANTITEVKYLGLVVIVAVACFYASWKIKEERRAEYEKYEKELAEAKAKHTIELTPEQFDTLKTSTGKLRSGITPPPPRSEEILKNVGTFLLGVAAEKGIDMALEGFFEKQQVGRSAKEAVAAALGTFDTVRTLKDVGDAAGAEKLLKKTLGELDKAKGALPSPAKCFVSFQCFEIARALGASLEELNTRGFETFKALAESTVLTEHINSERGFYTEEESHGIYQVYPNKQINLDYRGLLREDNGLRHEHYSRFSRVPKQLQSATNGEVLAAGMSSSKKSEHNLAAFTNKYLIRNPITSVHWRKEVENPIAEGFLSLFNQTAMLLTTNIAEATGNSLHKHMLFERPAQNYKSVEYLLTKALYDLNDTVSTMPLQSDGDGSLREKGLLLGHKIITFDDTEGMAKGYGNLLNVLASGRTPLI